MSRLIDADKLIEDLEKVKKESESLVDIAHIIGFQSVIDAQPTAYDVDKVVKELEKLADELEGEAIAMYKAECFDLANGLLSKAIGVRDAIEIVKGGGIDASKENC